MKLEMDKSKFELTDFGRAKPKTVVAFTQKVRDSQNVDPFTITASPSGISFRGSMQGELNSQQDLQDFAKLIGDVWAERLKLRPNIVMAGSNG